MSRLRVRWEKAKTILRTQGMIVLLKEMGLYLIELVYYRKVFILGTDDWSKELDLNKDDYRPNIDNSIVTKIVYSNQEAAQLEEQGFSFRYYPTDWNYNLTCYTDWLDNGVIACCTFIGTELGAISWVIPSQKAQNAIKTYPLKVNYANHEVFTRGVWVNPKYRGKGLWRYSRLCRDQLLCKAGMSVARTTVGISNTTGQSLQKASKTIFYGEGYEYRILGWKFWREKHNPLSR
jgi:hypothetical protein